MPAGMTQTGRCLQIETPLGRDKLLLKGLSGQEAVSQLFRFQLDLASEKEAIPFRDIVGKNVKIRLETNDGERYWNGFISRFSQGSQDQRFTYYRAEMVPWLWFLTRTADCRIFQRQTAPDIIKKIFDDLKFDAFELRLYGHYRKREYCVQYRETDFNFVSRLMEDEGICYFFEHEPDGSKHTLVLADGQGDKVHPPCPGQPIASCAFTPNAGSKKDLITEWQVDEEFRPSSWTHTDYNYEEPSTPLLVNVKVESGFEIYDYPGSYTAKRPDGDELAKTRLEETTALRVRARGKSNCRCFTTGTVVKLDDHYRKDLNRKWMLTAISHQASMGESYHSGGSQDDFFYANTFECVPDDVRFRPQRVTPKPNVQGCQTAVVTGPAGEEIHTDKYGCVKVQFHWDREGKKDEDTSCWIRTSQPWAGKDWGAVSIPRIGQEVIVDFLEGDPDQPIIVGRVYNAEQMPPYPLPAGAHHMGMKSKSVKGGGYNEISISDMNGVEGIEIHAQYNMNERVEHDHTILVGNNRTEEVKVDEKITIGVNRVEDVGSNETISIGKNRTETVGQNETVTVSMLRTHSVGINDMLNVGAAQEVTVGGAQAVSVGLMRAVSVGMAQQTTVGKSMTTNVGTDQSTKIGKNCVIDAGDSVTIKTGQASITMKKDGTIVISGKDISLKATGKINGKASGEIVLKGSKIAKN